MPTPELWEKIHEIADHSGPKAVSAEFPLEHFQQTITEFRTLVDHFDRKVGETANYLAVKNRHFARLHGMVMVNLIECLERFFKEVAAVCIDQVAGLVGDDRFADFKALAPGALRAHFETGSFGLALSESLTWLSCESVDGRFKKLLADPFEKGNFQLLPKQHPRTMTLEIVWQLRHTIIHNVGVLTRSDASKLRLLLRREVPADRVLEPTRQDLRFLTKFLEDVAEDCNRRIGERLALLLTVLHEIAPLFAPGPKADELSRLFGISLTVAGSVGTLPTQAP